MKKTEKREIHNYYTWRTIGTLLLSGMFIGLIKAIIWLSGRETKNFSQFDAGVVCTLLGVTAFCVGLLLVLSFVMEDFWW